MPTTTEITPAEVAALERRIAERVMGWTENDYDWMSWSPWNDPAAALAVLDRLQEMWSRGKAVPIIGIESYRRGNAHEGEKLHAVSISLCVKVRDVPGPHYGPAVCELARKVMKGR